MDKRKLTVDNSKEQQGELSFSLEGNGCLEGGGIDGGCPNGVAVEKGSESIPYTVAEYEKMCVDGSWSGGFVENLGLVEAQSTPSGTSGIYYSDWDFDIEEVKNDSYDEAKYEGSKVAMDNQKDCAYRCIARYLKGVNSIGVSDLYGDWLKNIKGVAEKDVSPAVADGLAISYMTDFLNFVLPKFGKELKNVYTGRKAWTLYQEGDKRFKENGSWNMIGTVEEIEKLVYHEIVVNGMSDDGYLIYYDPQNPNNNNKYPLGKLYKLYEIKDR